MSQRRHRPVPFLATALGLAATLGLAACEPAPPVALGFATSGAYLDAAILAVEDARAAGFDVPLDTVLIAEASNRAAPAIEASERLVAIPGLVAVIGHSNSAASLAASQLYNRARVVQIAPTASAVAYSRAGPFSFRMVPPDDRQGAFLADAVARDLSPGDTVAVLFVNDDYGRGLRDAFMAALPPTGLAAPLDLPYVENEMSPGEAGRTVEALGRLRPDAVVWLGRTPSLDTLLGELRGTLGDVPVFGGDALSAAPRVGTPDGRWAAVRYVEFADLQATDAGRRFVRDYEDRFGRTPGVPDALTYDATRIALEGIAAGARTGEELRAYLRGVGRDRPAYQGVSGAVRFDEDGGVDRPYVLLPVIPGGGS